MRMIYVDNVQSALPEGLRLLDQEGVWSESRAGRVISTPYPVMTIYQKPLERVLFWPARDANPFFHCMEALWMLAGRNDVEWLARFNSRMREFSDDGITFHGSYGYRWRNHFLGEDEPRIIDQLDLVCELLTRSPNSRRAVIQMWDCRYDLVVDESLNKDIPCNDMIFLSNNSGSLEMTVLCRSNDIIWGAYGANAVHFSMLQEYLAARLGWKVGKLYQLSNNFHAYEDVFNKNKILIDEAADWYRKLVNDPYQSPSSLGRVRPYPLVILPKMFDTELEMFMDESEYPDIFLEVEPVNVFLKYASALRRAYLLWKYEYRLDLAKEVILDHCPADFDFAVAALDWLDRRKS